MPTLTRTGLFALTGLAALVLGAGLTGHAILAVFAGVGGALMLASYARLGLLLFELRRERLEFSWTLVTASPTAGGAATLELVFRNRSALPWRGVRVELVGSEALVATEDASVDLPARSVVTATLPLETPRAGHWVAHGALLEFEDAAGLFRLAPYCARRLPIRVHTPPSATRTLRLALGAAAGARLRRQRGLGSDIRELREHRHGDPFRSIAWKASARRGKLMVRELEADVRVPVTLVLDAGPSMRLGALGRAPLDEGVAAASAVARALLDGGDPVGFVAFSSRRLVALPCGTGRVQLRRVEDAILDVAASVPVEDVRDGRVGQLRAIARFLGKETALRVHPDLAVPGDADLVLELASRALEKLERKGAVTALPESDDARIALFLHHHGLVPDAALEAEWGPRERGLLEALAAVDADPASPRLCVVLSDLRGLRDRALLCASLARRASKLRVTFAVPAAHGAEGDGDGARLRALAAYRDRRALAAQLARARARVLFANAHSPLETVALRGLDVW